ncbi:hypothetical protein HOK51_10115 [Candidatus Woesearchaeota archaeon]|jgi:hypothetical protein|nr:hypothetical protein [Candidatus Woesearchaeota archaeon]MBT6520179.1 hypothetical protein [Candidatus Woesearchaeota archaeon]MBT7367195.1 hypothetical protein [Candidatus Woesearchaeota archaeon]
MFKKRGQGLSMTVIVVAAIALLVLVILAVIFIGRMGTTAENVDKCKGDCVYSPEECTEMGKYTKVTDDPCDDESQYCCISIA